MKFEKWIIVPLYGTMRFKFEVNYSWGLKLIAWNWIDPSVSNPNLFVDQVTFLGIAVPYFGHFPKVSDSDVSCKTNTMNWKKKYKWISYFFEEFFRSQIFMTVCFKRESVSIPLWQKLVQMTRKRIVIVWDVFLLSTTQT